MRTSSSNMMENGVMVLSMVYCSIHIVMYMCVCYRSWKINNGRW